MRLRQLSRKLGVHPDKILAVLTDNGHEAENDPNSKLTAEQVEIVQTHFPTPAEPKKKSVEAAPAAVEEETPAETPVEEAVATVEQPEAVPAAAESIH